MKPCLYVRACLCVCVCEQLSSAEALGKPGRELAVIHVSLAATYSDLRQPHMAVEHYRQELTLRQGNPTEVHQPWAWPGTCTHKTYTQSLTHACIEESEPGNV